MCSYNNVRNCSQYNMCIIMVIKSYKYDFVIFKVLLFFCKSTDVIAEIQENFLVQKSGHLINFSNYCLLSKTVKFCLIEV